MWSKNMAIFFSSAARIFFETKGYISFLAKINSGLFFIQPNISSWTSNSPLHFFKVGFQCFSNETI